MSEHFPILIDVEEHQVGKVLRQLDVMPGIVTIHLKMGKGGTASLPRRGRPPMLGTDAPAEPHKRRRSGTDETTAANVIMQALLAANGSLHYKILIMAITRLGYSPGSLYKYLTALRDKKLVRRVAAGTYRLTERGEARARGGSTAAAVPQLARSRGRPSAGQGTRGTLRHIILAQLARNEFITHKELSNYIASQAFSRNNIYTMVPRLMQDGLVSRNGDNYEITEMGRQRLTTFTSAEPADHPNGENT